MPELAFQDTMIRLLWLGLEPRVAHEIASLRYPMERMNFDDTLELDAYCEVLFWANSFGLCEGIGNATRRETIEQLRNDPAVRRVAIYLDGGNLIRSLAHIQQVNRIRRGIIESVFRRDRRFYNPQIAFEMIPWYVAWCYELAQGDVPRAVARCCLALAPDGDVERNYLSSLEHNYGVEVLQADKSGEGKGSSSEEDIVLKAAIQSDFARDSFDIAIIGTGDGRRDSEGGISFPELASILTQRGKTVEFVGFGFSASTKITDNYEFFDLAMPLAFPWLSGPEHREWIDEADHAEYRTIQRSRLAHLAKRAFRSVHFRER